MFAVSVDVNPATTSTPINAVSESIEQLVNLIDTLICCQATTIHVITAPANVAWYFFSVASVCLSVFNTLTFESFDLETSFYSAVRIAHNAAM